MKHILITIIVLSSLSLGARAQMVLHSDDFTSRVGVPLNDDYYTVTDSNLEQRLEQIAAATGQNQTWDFSNFNYTVSGTSQLEMFAGTSNAPENTNPLFASSNYVFHDTDSSSDLWEYLTITGDGFSVNGEVDVPTQTVYGYSPALEFIAFPAMFGSSWSSTSQPVLDSSVLPGGYGIHLTVASVVDGEGTLLLPGGKTVQCLRMKQMVTINVDQVPGLNDSSVSYAFMNHDDFELASFSLDHSSTVSGMFSTTAHVQYQIPKTDDVRIGVDASSLGVRIAENPARSAMLHAIVTLPSACDVTLALYDVLGNRVRTMNAGNLGAGSHDLALDAAALAQGTYLLRLESGNSVATTNVLIER